MTFHTLRRVVWCLAAVLVFANCTFRPHAPGRSPIPPGGVFDSLGVDSTALDSLCGDTTCVDSALVDSLPDSLRVAPRPVVFISGQSIFDVRTKLVPRVMGRGWTLLVNKPDSLEFFRRSDTTLSLALFGVAHGPTERIRLRFRLQQDSSRGTWIALMGHLVGREGDLPEVAFEAPLMENLAALRDDLLAAPPTQDPKKKRKKH
ncbi:MAG: hypothetical protein H6686_04360 [Fibrobacteria bacterium]|nr:hypothetical protein [Fibrobacteria bacterium]